MCLSNYLSISGGIRSFPKKGSPVDVKDRLPVEETLGKLGPAPAFCDYNKKCAEDI